MTGGYRPPLVTPPNSGFAPKRAGLQHWGADGPVMCARWDHVHPSITLALASASLAPQLTATGVTFFNAGAAARIDYTLPAPVAPNHGSIYAGQVSYEMAFLNFTTHGTRLVAPPGVKIVMPGAETADGGYLETVQRAARVRVLASSLTEWMVIEISGVWTAH